LDKDDALKSASSLSVAGSRHLPSVFTGLGIVFTFFGLILGLLHSDLAAISGGDAAVKSVELKKLLNGVGLAFRSSLVGVGSSIVYTIVFRIYDALIEKEANAVREAALQKDRQGAPDEVLQKTYLKIERLVDLTRQETAKIGELGTDIKTAFENVLSAELEEKVGSRISALDDRLSSFTRQQAETQQELMDEALDTFQQEFARNLNKEFGQLESTLDKHIEQQARLQEHVENAVSEAESLARRFSTHEEKLNELLVRRKDMIDRREQLEQQREERLQTFLTDLDEAVSELCDIGDSFSEWHREWEAMLSSLDEGTNELEGAVSSLQDAQETFEHTASRTEKIMNEAPEQLEASVERMQHELEGGLQQTFERFDEETAAVVDHLGGTHRKIESMVEELGRLFEDLEQGISVQVALLREVDERLQSIETISTREAIVEQDDMKETENEEHEEKEKRIETEETENEQHEGQSDTVSSEEDENALEQAE
jgi:ABC-type transporter Mla subunit MlaD